MTGEMELRICELYEHYETAREVSEIVGYSNECVRRVLKKHGIPRTHRHPKAKSSVGNNHKSIDRERVGELYRSGVSIHSIAQQLGCSDNTVYYHLDKIGLYKIGQRKSENDALVSRILEMHEYGMSDYEIADAIGVARQSVNERLRKRGIRRGRGSNSRKGGIACGQKLRERAKKRFDSVAHLVELLEYVDHEKSRVRCVKCGREFMWYKDHWKMDVPCPDCRAEISRRAREKERKQKKYERKQQLEAAREWCLSVPRICKHCGMPFYSEYETAAYCSPQCKHKAKVLRSRQRQSNKGRHGRNPYKRRMRIVVNENTFDRTVTLDAVYKKYRGKCCSCGCKTVRSKSPVPNQATVDHVIALNNFGTHTWDNVQLLCMDCNRHKSDKGQMRLAV